MDLDQKTNVLIVDDMSISRQILLTLLENNGLTNVRTAQDASRAMDEVARERPDIVIADLHMPGRNGYELLQKLRQDEATAGLPFILTSGDDSNPLVVQSLEEGADSFLPKPFKVDDLLRAIKVVLMRGRARRWREQSA